MSEANPRRLTLGRGLHGRPVRIEKDSHPRADLPTEVVDAADFDAASGRATRQAVELVRIKAELERHRTRWRIMKRLVRR